MDINNLLFSCEHPKKITTKDGRSMFVSCGKCLSCIVSKQHSKSDVCSQQEKISKYTFFVTLTYNKDNIPCAYPVYEYTEPIQGRKQIVSLFDEDTGEFLGSSVFPHSKLRNIIKRSDDGKLHYARFFDVQKFIKRVRRIINYNFKSNEKISYYCVSEYGPRSFRPHFHILFYLDSAELAQAMGQIVRKAWSFGYTYTTLSNGHCTSYVASYVNSFVALPEVFKICSIKPKSSHSTCLALPIFTEEFKKIYKNEPCRLVRSVEHRRSDGLLSYDSPWRSYKSYLFPKCYGYAFKSFFDRLGTYTVLQKCRKLFGKDKTITELSNIILNKALSHQLNKTVNKSLFRQVDGEYVTPTLDIIKSRLYQSNHFLQLCIKFGIQPYKLCSNIDKFYSSLDYANLRDQYSILENASRTLPSEDFELLSKCYVFNGQLENEFVINDIHFEGSFLLDIYKKSLFYQNIQSRCKLSYQKSIKHKVLNDLNKVLL